VMGARQLLALLVLLLVPTTIHGGLSHQPDHHSAEALITSEPQSSQGPQARQRPHARQSLLLVNTSVPSSVAPQPMQDTPEVALLRQQFLHSFQRIKEAVLAAESNHFQRIQEEEGLSAGAHHFQMIKEAVLSAEFNHFLRINDKVFTEDSHHFSDVLKNDLHDHSHSSDHPHENSNDSHDNSDEKSHDSSDDHPDDLHDHPLADTHHAPSDSSVTQHTPQPSRPLFLPQ
ncbi:hypothetical protein OTU49_009966, partial [Cherax quadricarinatus]